MFPKLFLSVYKCPVINMNNFMPIWEAIKIQQIFLPSFHIICTDLFIFVDISYLVDISWKNNMTYFIFPQIIHLIDKICLFFVIKNKHLNTCKWNIPCTLEFFFFLKESRIQNDCEVFIVSLVHSEDNICIFFNIYSEGSNFNLVSI